jgi:hypothetical protein
MDRKEIRKALDHFENDEYVDAKEIISKEIAGKRDVFLQNKIELTNPISPVPKTDDDKTDDDGNKGDEGE